MLQELIDAVNAYRLKHSESEAIGGRGVEGLNDAYAHMLAVCDAAEQSVQRTCAKAPGGEHYFFYNNKPNDVCLYCGASR